MEIEGGKDEIGGVKTREMTFDLVESDSQLDANDDVDTWKC